MEHENERDGYKPKYRTLKRKLKSLVYEHEMLNEQLEKSQKKLLRVSRDRSFLLDRMLQYEKVNDSSSDSEITDLSDSDNEKPVIKKKPPPVETTPLPEKKKKAAKKKAPKKQPPMASDELERRLESRAVKPAIEKATLSMPTEIFNTEIEGDSDDISEGEIDPDSKNLMMDCK